MTNPLEVLFVYPRCLFFELVRGALCSQTNVHLTVHSTAERAEAALLTQKFDIALISGQLDGDPAVLYRLLRKIRDEAPGTKPIVIYDRLEKEQTVQAFTYGMRGVLAMQDCDFNRLCRCLDRVSSGHIWASHAQINWIVDALVNQYTAPAPTYTRNTFGRGVLTNREAEVVALLSEGKTNREIARRLNLSEHTIRNCLFRVFEKLGVSNRMELLARAFATNRTNQLDHSPWLMLGETATAAPALRTED
jgi:DNA-binding NarL/FixJ family response regulator